ncbi:MAG TPA: ceramidase domain-containing protein [Candidatus Competibacteraceae bacterium]|nr:ceramidase domain-containing protein [Candidatus Competibacteraceae bacterium]
MIEIGAYPDQYCERIAAGPWGEPLNLLSSLAFLLAAALALRLYRAQPGLRPGNSPDLLALIALLTAIGIGSGLWHALATRWAELLDVIPIMLFISLYLLSTLYRVFRLGVWGTAGVFLAYQALNQGVVLRFPPETLNGSIFYLPTWGCLLLLALWLRRRHHPLGDTFLAALGLFTLSLGCRTLDLALCATIPSGTHFLWHALNGLLLYLLLAGLIRAAAAQTRA